MLVSSENTGVMLDAHAIHEIDLTTLTFSVERTVDIGKAYASGMYEHMGYSFGPDDDIMPALPHPPLSLPVGDADALMAQELERRTNDADKAYADLQEALDAFGEDDTPEAQRYIDEYRMKYEAAEELREELTDDDSGIVEATGKLFDTARFIKACGL